MALSLNQIKKKPVQISAIKTDDIAFTIKNEEQMTVLDKPSKPWSNVVTNLYPTSHVDVLEQKDQQHNIDNFFESRSNFTNPGSGLGGIGLWCEVLSV